jgi:hypothetical protein
MTPARGRGIDVGAEAAPESPMDDLRKLDDAALEKVRQAAEETGWLVGRGYPTEETVSFVSRHHELGPQELRWLDCGTRANRSYRHHIARELDPDDVARRPLRIDASSIVATVEAALRGSPLLEAGCVVRSQLEPRQLCRKRCDRAGARARRQGAGDTST